MSGELSFIDLNGEELANAYRTLSYLQRGLGPLTFQVGSLGCAILGREIGGVGPFVSPSTDPAPWYDATVPESSEFLGFVPRLDFQTVDIKRSISQRFGGIGGGVIGVEQFAARMLSVEGFIIASTCPGLEYGRHWLYSKLGADCAGCALDSIRVRESCPPDNGSNDTRGERIMYDAALVGGIERFDVGGQGCCEYDGISFQIAAESPYLYSRAGAATSPVEVQSSGAIMHPLPAALDTFVRANTGPPPSASWTGTTILGETNTLRVLSNLLNNSTAVGAGTTGSAHWNAATFGPNVTAAILVPTRVQGGRFEVRARVTTPGTTTTKGNFIRVFFNAVGADTMQVGRHDYTLGDTYASAPGQTFTSGDTFAIVCRGNLIEGWRKAAAGGAWTRIVSTYDATVPVAGSVGVAITQVGFQQDLSTFSAGTLTNAVFPTDVITIPIPAVTAGLTSPIVTITSDEAAELTAAQIVAHGVRVQLKQYANCSESDDFAVNDLATKWYQPAGWYTITGGKLKPVATTGTKTIQRSYDGTSANRVQYVGGRVEATIKVGATLTNGAWGVMFNSLTLNAAGGAFLVKTAGASTNAFILATSPSSTPDDTVAFTPVAGTTYRIIFEVFPTAVSGVYTVHGYLIDQAAPTLMLTRPLVATIGTLNPIGPDLVPAISSVPADTAEEWDSFYAIDYADSDTYINANIPPGVLIIDASRRVSEFTPAGATSSYEGSGYLSTPIDTPLGWVDVCADTGPGCLQVFGSEVAFPSTTVSVALQSRVR